LRATAIFSLDKNGLIVNSSGGQIHRLSRQREGTISPDAGSMHAVAANIAPKSTANAACR